MKEGRGGKRRGESRRKRRRRMREEEEEEDEEEEKEEEEEAVEEEEEEGEEEEKKGAEGWEYAAAGRGAGVGGMRRVVNSTKSLDQIALFIPEHNIMSVFGD